MSEKKPKNWCRFRLADVICPEQRQALFQITPDLEVEGEIVFLSDHGDQPGKFAIIEVKGILSPLIVPADRLRAVLPVSESRAEGPRLPASDGSLERVAAHK